MTWANYVPPEVIKDFETETGIKVNYKEFTTNEEMLMLFQNQTNQYDLIVCSDYIIEIMIQEGNLLRELDRSKLPNYSNISPAFQSQYYDPENKYTIPYATGCALLIYDPAQVGFEVKGYKDLWNPSLKDSVVLLDGARDIIGMTLQMQGESINETDPAKLDTARQKLLELKPNIISFDADQPHNAIINGDAKIGLMFGSQATAAMEEVDGLVCVYPEEGLSIYIDNFVMSAQSPNTENAYRFLNYMLDGKVSAKASSIINYANTNTAAQEFLPQEFLDNETVNIPEHLLGKTEMYQGVGEADLIYDEIWTEVKAAR